MDADNAAMSGTTIDDVVRRLSSADTGTLRCEVRRLSHTLAMPLPS